MSKQPESIFKEKVRVALEKLPNVWFEKIQQVSIRGTPDFLMCVNGHFVALELKKSETAEVSELQLYKLNKIAQAGGVSFLTYPENWKDTYRIIEEMATTEVVYGNQLIDRTPH